MCSELYFKKCLFEVISYMATSTGSIQKRLNESFCLISHCLYNDEYLKNMQKHTQDMVIELRKIYQDIRDNTLIKFKEEYGNVPQEKNFRPLRYIHYKQAKKIIDLIVNLYENL